MDCGFDQQMLCQAPGLCFHDDSLFVMLLIPGGIEFYDQFSLFPGLIHFVLIRCPQTLTTSFHFADLDRVIRNILEGEAKLFFLALGYYTKANSFVAELEFPLTNGSGCR